MFEKHEMLLPSKKLLHHIIIYPFILHLLNFPYHSTSSFRHRLYFSPFTSHFRLESSIFPPFFKIRISKFTRNFRKILYTYRHLYLSMGENVHKTRYRIKFLFRFCNYLIRTQLQLWPSLRYIKTLMCKQIQWLFLVSIEESIE